jgi:hypothetical protein
LKAIKQDKIIYHGYAGQLLLKDLPHVLKLRVEAPLEYRVKAVMAELNYTYDQSVDYIKKVDIQRKRWVKMVYNNDWYNPQLYDLWVNLQHMSMDNICEMVALSIDHEDFKTSEHAIMCLNNMSLECEVRAALASDDEIWRNQEVTVNAYDGIIILRGTTKNKQLRDLIVDTTSKVKGVKECKSDISLLSDGLTK